MNELDLYKRIYSYWIIHIFDMSYDEYEDIFVELGIKEYCGFEKKEK